VGQKRTRRAVQYGRSKRRIERNEQPHYRGRAEENVDGEATAVSSDVAEAAGTARPAAPDKAGAAAYHSRRDRRHGGGEPASTAPFEGESAVSSGVKGANEQHGISFFTHRGRTADVADYRASSKGEDGEGGGRRSEIVSGAVFGFARQNARPSREAEVLQIASSKGKDGERGGRRG